MRVLSLGQHALGEIYPLLKLGHLLLNDRDLVSEVLVSGSPSAEPGFFYAKALEPKEYRGDDSGDGEA